MGKAKEDFSKLVSDEALYSMEGTDTLLSYIEELQKENEYFRLLYQGINKHVALLQQVTGKELDVLFDPVEKKDE